MGQSMSSPTGRGSGISINEIAELAGVSTPTVSKVLNGRPDVAPATRERVEAIIRQHNYTRRRAKSQTTPQLLDLVFHELDSAWATEIIRGVEQLAAEKRVGVVLSDLGGKNRANDRFIEDVLSRRPLGVIMVQSTMDAAQIEQLKSRNIPTVVVDTDGEPPSGTPTVGSSNWNGGFAAAKHLIELGHTNIAVISGRAEIMCSRLRIDGFRAAMDQYGIPVNPELIRNGNFYVSGGYAHGLELLQGEDRPTAIFAGSDLQAFGVMRAARELGLQVPDDLSVVGYDDLPITEWLYPPLATIRQPLQEMAHTATNMIFDLAQGRAPINGNVELGTTLVVRQSTAPPAHP